MANIQESIKAIMGEMGAIEKAKENTQGFRFKYRGIDDVYNELHGLLAKHGVFTVPEVLPETMVSTEVVSKSGGVIFNKACVIRYHFVAEDGTRETATVIGSAMDSGDKAWNKAMSVAHKYAFFQMFAIATDDIDDPDASTHEVVTKASIKDEQAMRNGHAQIAKLIEDNGDILAPEYIDGVRADAEKAKTVPDLRAVWKDIDDTVKRERAAETKARTEEAGSTITDKDVKDHKRKLFNESVAKLKADVDGAEPDDEADKDGQPLF